MEAASEETPENQRPRPVFRPDPEPVDRSRRWEIKTVEEAGVAGCHTPKRRQYKYCEVSISGEELG